MSFITLPVEILEFIIRTASIEAVQALALTCRSIYRIVVNYGVHWQQLYRALYITDMEDNEEIAWLEQTRRRLQSQNNNTIWWQLLNRRKNLEAHWRGQTSHGLLLQFKRNLPLRRPTPVELFARPDWILATNGRKTALINAESLKLSWLAVDTPVNDMYSTYLEANPLTRKRLKLSKHAIKRMNEDEPNMADVRVRRIALSDKYAVVKIKTALIGGCGRVQVWRIADQRLIVNQAIWSYVNMLELRGRWLHYVEDHAPSAHSGKDRLIVLDLEATDPPRSMHRLISPVSGMEAHLQRVSATEAELFHNYYIGRTHHWCLFRITANGNDKMLKTMPLPPTKIYPGHATCIRVEHDHDQVLIYGQGDHRFGFTTWVAILRLSDNRLMWECDVGFTPSRESMDILQVTGGGSPRCHYLVWPFGQQAVKILSMSNGDTIHFISLDNRSIISMVGQPIIGTLVLIALMNLSNNTNQCLMLDVQSGELVDGPILNHTTPNRRTVFSATTTHLLRWDSKELEVYSLCKQTK